MSDMILILVSVIIFAVLAKFTDQSARLLCCFIKGAALILIANCALTALGLGTVSLNLFTAPAAGALGVPAIGLFVLYKIFFL